jgi:hypothetical protein
VVARDTCRVGNVLRGAARARRVVLGDEVEQAVEVG